MACRDIFSLQRRASGMIDQQSYTSPAPVLHFLAQKRSSGCPAGAKAALPRHLLCSLCKGDTRLRWLMVFPGPRWTKFPPFAGAHRGKVTNSSRIHPCALEGGGVKDPLGHDTAQSADASILESLKWLLASAPGFPGLEGLWSSPELGGTAGSKGDVPRLGLPLDGKHEALSLAFGSKCTNEDEMCSL